MVVPVTAVVVQRGAVHTGVVVHTGVREAPAAMGGEAVVVHTGATGQAVVVVTVVQDIVVMVVVMSEPVVGSGQRSRLRKRDRFLPEPESNGGARPQPRAPWPSARGPRVVRLEEVARADVPARLSAASTSCLLPSQTRGEWPRSRRQESPCRSRCPTKMMVAVGGLANTLPSGGRAAHARR